MNEHIKSIDDQQTETINRKKNASPTPTHILTSYYLFDKIIII